MKVLYDGWALAYAPNSPAALHLLALLAYHPPEAEAWVALPARTRLILPPEIPPHLAPTPDTPRGRLGWEQRRLGNLAKTLGASLVHLVTATPPLFGPPRSLVSPTGYGGRPWLRAQEVREPPDPQAGVVERLRGALGQGGMARVRGVLWPEDLPAPPQISPRFLLPPVVHPAFLSPYQDSIQEAGWRAGTGNGRPPGGNGRTEAGEPDRSLSWEGPSLLELPESFILYHGPGSPNALRRLLDAWTWAAPALGEYYPLLLLGLDASGRAALPGLLEEYGLGKTVRVLPLAPLASIVALYQGCAALFHPAAVAPWGGPLRLALACGRPVVSLQSQWADALVGPAAYLVPLDNQGLASSRALGAALITVVVEESVARPLSAAARQRTQAWGAPEAFRERLAQIYRELSGINAI